MSRRYWILGLVWLCLGPTPIADLHPWLGISAQSVASGIRVPDLQTTLEMGLRARRPEEFAFIGRVVKMVEDGDLPLKLVKGTFNWARKKRPYPYPYFERSLKLQAAKRGIVVK